MTRLLSRPAMWLVPLFALPLLFLACGGNGGGGGDDDHGSSAVDQITAVVEEMTAGAMARTEAALEQKVFPHVSADYQHAGLDQSGYEDRARQDLLDNPDTVFDNYTLTVTVTMQGDQAAAVDARNVFTGVIKANKQQHREFDIDLSGENDGTSNFALEHDGQWRVAGGDARFGSWQMNGGDNSLKTDVTPVGVDQHDAAPADHLHLTGTVNLPDVGAGQQIFATAALSWEDKRNNAEQWVDADSIYWNVELTDHAGSSYDFDVVLPDDGEPSGLAIPATLPPGADAIGVQVLVYVTEPGPEDELTIIRLDGSSFSLPYEPLANADPCPTSLTENDDGLWKLQTVSDVHESLNLFELADLRQVNGDIYGAVLYAAPNETGGHDPVALEVTGQASGGFLNFAFSNADLTVTYEATLDGAQIVDGTVTFATADGTIAVSLTGEKLDNRCESINLDNLDGEVISMIAGANTTSFDVDQNGMNVTLSNTSGDYTGYAIRNLLLALDEADSNRWLLLGFRDSTGGLAYAFDNGILGEGTFSAQ
jgi:hypothetical protein